MAEVAEKQMIFTTKFVDEATEKINDGIVIKRFQNPWLKSEVGLRRAGVSFKMSPEEQQEYVTGVQTCALPIRSEEHTSELQSDVCSSDLIGRAHV